MIRSKKVFVFLRLFQLQSLFFRGFTECKTTVGKPGKFYTIVGEGLDFFYFALQLAMPRASLGKLKNTIFPSRGYCYDCCSRIWPAKRGLRSSNTLSTNRGTIYIVLAPLCAHNNILSFDRNSAKRQQQEPHVYVCTLWMYWIAENRACKFTKKISFVMKMCNFYVVCTKSRIIGPHI